MSRWLQRALNRIHKCAAAGTVRFTLKALHEIAQLALALDEMDAVDVLSGLGTTDSAGRVRSRRTGEWMYVFRPRVAGMPLYVKVILRGDCVVVSFHEDSDETEEEEGDETH